MLEFEEGADLVLDFGLFYFVFCFFELGLLSLLACCLGLEFFLEWVDFFGVYFFYFLVEGFDLILCFLGLVGLSFVCCCDFWFGEGVEVFLDGVGCDLNVLVFGYFGFYLVEDLVCCGGGLMVVVLFGGFFGCGGLVVDLFFYL